MIHGSKTWPTNKKHYVKLHRTEESMLRWMCGFLTERNLLQLAPSCICKNSV